MNKYNFPRHEEREKKAIKHTEVMGVILENEIKDSIENSIVYRDEIKVDKHGTSSEMKIDVVSMTSEEAVLTYSSKGCKDCTLLNFASYKHPGGGFNVGSMAQEEAICHASNLYNVIKEFEEEYVWNRDHLNKAMYTNFGIFSPNIVFQSSNGDYVNVNVITCPAPNRRVYTMYNNDIKVFNDTLKSRIKFLLDMAEVNNQKTLILGAFGCGVFRNKAEEVAQIFKELLTNGDYSFEHIIFAIPGKDYNYNQFEKVFN